MNEIFLLKLKKEPTHLPKPKRLGTSAVSSNRANIAEFWVNASDDIRNEVLAEQPEVQDIEAIAFVIVTLPDVTIFSTTKTENNDSYSNPFVIANEHIKESTPLAPGINGTKGREIVIVDWEDATYNFRGAEAETIKLIPGVVISTTVGFLVDSSNERIMVLGRYNKEDRMYKDRRGIPQAMIRSLDYLIPDRKTN